MSPLNRLRHCASHGPKALALLTFAALLTACSHMGPRTVAVDRFDYSSAIGESWKQQTLLNIVKLRYMDLPVFVDVSSIVAGYSMQTGVNVNGVLSSSNAMQGDYLSAGGQAIYTDRPTITYVPMVGEKFLRGLINPIDPKHIFFLLQAGYPADFILGLTVNGLNGVRNRSSLGGHIQEADPAFLRALQLIREVNDAGAVGLRVEEDKARGQSTVLFFRKDDMPEEVVNKASEIRQLLNLPQDQQRLLLVYSPARGAANELTVNSRSMMQIMNAFAGFIDIPEEDMKEHRATPSFAHEQQGSDNDELRIHSGKNRPDNAFAAVRYRGHWFWIDDSSLRTKRAITAVMFLFTLTETGTNDRLPLITIPAQ